jgi:octaprenyl-diphosphate synthase
MNNKADRKIRPLLDLTRQDMATLNEIILSKAGSNVELIPKLARYLIDSGGKRLRPMLTVAMAGMCGYSGSSHIPLACAVEFMHTATLLHDDVVDESDMRRGKKTARLLWSNQASVLVGDFLLGQAFKMMVEVGNLEALAILSNAAAVIAEGEVMQLAAAKDLETGEEQYLEIIISKTAALFMAAAELGPVVADRPEQEKEAARVFGLNLGLAFQLMDDALDYSGEAAKLGKAVGDDFREGKITFPVIMAYAQGNAEEKKFWQRTLQDENIKDGDLDHSISLMREHKAIEATIARAGYYGNLASKALEAFPDGDYRSALIAVVDFCLHRTH